MDDKDLKVRFTRGSGPGGQHKNKVETCVIVTHTPSGLQERCQDTRSRERNLELAKKRLAVKLAEAEAKRVQDANNERRKELIKNQKVVRTYNFVRNEVVDHRRKTKHNLKKFMRGEIEL
jgi:peptide chain release factor 1